MTELRTFTGRVVPDDGEPLDVEVVVGREAIRMMSGTTEIGEWSVSGCHLERAGDDAFTIGEDGDAVRFEPDDSSAFQDVVERVAEGSLDTLFGGGMAGDDSGPFEIDVTVAGDPGGEIEIDPGPEDAGVGTGYLDTVSEVDLPGSSAPLETDDPAESEPIDIPSAPVESDDDGLEPGDVGAAESEAVHEGEDVTDESSDGSVATASEEYVENAVNEPEDTETDLGPEADSSVTAEDMTDDVQDAGAAESPDTPTGASDDPAEGSEPSESTAPVEEDEDAAIAELRGSFGRRLSRRRVAAPPPPAVDSEVESSEVARDEIPAPEGGETDAEGIDLEAISAGVGQAEPASDTAALAAAVDALREHTDMGDLSGSTVADTILEAQRSLRSSSSKASELPARLKKVAVFLGVIILLGGLGLGGYLAFQLLAASSPEDTVPTTLVAGATTAPQATAPPVTTVPATTVAPTTTVPRQPTAFELSAPEFVARWNDTAEKFNPALRLPSLLPGDFEFQLTPYIVALGSVGDTGSISQISLLIDPSGPSESDALGIQAMGVLIAAVDPNLDGQERKSLLASMGFDVEKPALVGVDGLSARNGVAYRLVYNNEAVQLTFTASPA